MSQVDVYPSPTIPAQSSSSSRSNGSFAPVLIVLAMIFVLVIVSVVLGRICNRRYHSSKGEHSHSKVGGKKSKKKDKFHPHQQQHPAGDGDIEFGFDKRFASSKVASNGDHHFNFKAPKMPHGGGGGEPKGPAVRFADDHIEFRTGA